MNCQSEDVQHIMSFRGSNMAAIEASQAYFDNLSQEPLSFINRMIILLENKSINHQQRNLVLTLIKKVLSNNLGSLTIQHIHIAVKFFWSNSIEIGGNVNQTVIEILLLLLSKINIQSLVEKINELIYNFWTNGDDPSLKLLLEIVKCKDICSHKFICFENRDLCIPNWRNLNFSKQNYAQVLTEIESLHQHPSFGLNFLLELFPYNPQQISQCIQLKYIQDKPSINHQIIFDYLRQQYFSLEVSQLSEQTFGGIVNLITAICQQAPKIKNIPANANLLAWCNSTQIEEIQKFYQNFVISPPISCIYFTWLINVYKSYEKKIKNEEVEDEIAEIRELNRHLCILCETYYYLFALPITKLFEVLVSQTVLNQSFQTSACFFIGASFTRFIPFKAHQITKGQITSTLTKGLKLPIGLLYYVWKFIAHNLKQNQTVSEKMKLFQLLKDVQLTNLATFETDLVIKCYRQFLKVSDLDFAHIVYLCDSLPTDIERCRLMELVLQYLKEAPVNQNIAQLILGWTSDFNMSPDYIKLVELQMISALVDRYGLLMQFSEVYQHIQSFQINSNHLDAFAQMITSMIKVYNINCWSLDGFPEYCESIFLVTCQSYEVYELMMEIINLPSTNIEIIYRTINMLVQNLDQNNSKMLDILEIFTLYYPMSASKRSEAILNKLSGKQYYRFYWRLKPKHPPKAIDFLIDDMVTLKWVVLSYTYMMDKNYENSCSRQIVDLESLIYSFEELTIDGDNKGFWNSLVEKFMVTQDNKNHWIGNWETNSVRKTIKRDFEDQSKKAIQKKLQKVMKLKSVPEEVEMDG